MNITKISKYNKKMNSTFTTKIKTNKYTLRYIMNTCRTLLKLANTKNLKYENIKYERVNTQPMTTKTI